MCRKSAAASKHMKVKEHTGVAVVVASRDQFSVTPARAFSHAPSYSSIFLSRLDTTQV